MSFEEREINGKGNLYRQLLTKLSEESQQEEVKGKLEYTKNKNEEHKNELLLHERCEKRITRTRKKNKFN